MTTEHPGGPPPINPPVAAGYWAGRDSTTTEPPGPVRLRPGEHHPDHVLIAASVAANGWPVLALWPGTKKPTHRGSTAANHADHWLTSPTAVVDAADEHDDREPPEGARRGCPSFAAMTGQPSPSLGGLALVALDADVNGDWTALHDLLAEAGPDAVEWGAKTLRVQRTNDRAHLWGTIPASGCPTTGYIFKAREGDPDAPAIEWRGSTGYVALPGARHRSGALYKVTGGRYEFTDGAQPEGALFVGITDPDDADPLGLAAWVHPLPVPESLLAVIRRRIGASSGVPTGGGTTTAKARELIGGRSTGPPELETGAAYERLLDALRDAGLAVRERGQGCAVAQCPAHDDREPSLSLRSAVTATGGGTVLLKCFTGCDTADVLDALRLRMSDLYDDDTNGGGSVTLLALEDDDLDAPEAMTEGEHGNVLEHFWEARPLLRSLLQFARARRVGPWALLGAVLARAAASVPPSVVLPPTRGAVASLNLFVGLCSESSGGKTTAMEAAREFLEVSGGTSDFLDTSPGSGEGLLAAYVFVRTQRGKPPEVVQSRLSVLFDVDEVSSLGALVGRTNSTLLPTLKSAWSGKTLANQNAEASRLRRVEAHRYRLVLVAGVQPVNAGTILDDEGGGFPQRWLWMPTYDPGMLPREARPAEPLPWSWQVPEALRVEVLSDGTILWPLRRVLALPDEAVAAILDAAEAHNRPIGGRSPESTLDGHALLTRAKVAAVLALLDGRADEVSSADWSLAGVVMRVSDRTRAAVVAARGAAAARAEDRKAVRVGRSAAIASESEVEHRTVRCMAVIRAALARNPGEHSTNTVLNKYGGSRYRDVSTEALERMVASGELIAEDRTASNGQQTTYYRPAVGS